MSNKSFHDYMRSYGEDHQHPVNKAIHMLCIPAIVASLPMMLVAPKKGIKVFATGWALQFVGHAIEGKKPSFSNDLRYLAVGPVWSMVEWVELLTGTQMYTAPKEKTTEVPPENASVAEARA